MNRYPLPPTHTPLIFPNVPTHVPQFKPREYNPHNSTQASTLLNTIWNPLKTDTQKKEAYDTFLRIFLVDWKNSEYRSPFSHPESVTFLLTYVEQLLDNTKESYSIRKTYLNDIKKRLSSQRDALMANEFKKLHLGGKRKQTRRYRKSRKQTRKH